MDERKNGFVAGSGARLRDASTSRLHGSPDGRGTGPNPASMEVDLALMDFTICRLIDLASFTRRKLDILV